MAFAFARFRFFGREIVNFAVTLPIILPGVITGVALASFFLFTNTDLSMRTVIVGHTTFCIVLVFNNVLARLRRVSPSLEEASRDLGASGLQTFRLRDAPDDPHGAGGRRAAVVRAVVRRDRGHVLPRRRGHDDAAAVDPRRASADAKSLPEVNAVATVILVVSLPMIAIAAYLMRDEGAASRVVQGE